MADATRRPCLDRSKARGDTHAAQAKYEAELIRKGEHPDYLVLPRPADSLDPEHEARKISIPAIAERANQISIADTIRKEVNVRKHCFMRSRRLKPNGKIHLMRK